MYDPHDLSLVKLSMLFQMLESASDHVLVEMMGFVIAQRCTKASTRRAMVELVLDSLQEIVLEESSCESKTPQPKSKSRLRRMISPSLIFSGVLKRRSPKVPDVISRAEMLNQLGERISMCLEDLIKEDMIHAQSWFNSLVPEYSHHSSEDESVSSMTYSSDEADRLVSAEWEDLQLIAQRQIRHSQSGSKYTPKAVFKCDFTKNAVLDLVSLYKDVLSNARVDFAKVRSTLSYHIVTLSSQESDEIVEELRDFIPHNHALPLGLGTEHWLKVFEFLDYHQVSKSIGSCNRWFLKVSRSVSYWRSLDSVYLIRNWIPRNIDDEKAVFHRIKHVKCIKRISPSFTKDMIPLITQYCSQLQYLDIRNSGNVPIKLVMKLLNANLSLTSLNISKCLLLNDRHVSQLTSILTKLECLDISDCPLLTGNVFKEFQGADSLQSLTINWTLDHCVDLLEGNGIGYLCKYCPRLSSFSIAGRNSLELSPLKELCGMCPIASLGLSNLSAIDDELLAHCLKAVGSSLICLKLENCPLLSENCLTLISEESNLSTLSLSNCLFGKLSNGYFQSMSNLQELDLENIKIDSSTIKSLGEHCIGLKRLSLHSMASNDVSFICKNLLLLEYLSVEDCNLFRDEDVVLISKSFRKMRKLHLLHCENISSSSVDTLCSSSHVEHLHALSITYCAKLPISRIVTSFVHLEYLDISGCTNFSEQDCNALINSTIGVSIRTLKLENIPTISDRLLSLLSVCFRTLSGLSLSGCPQISDESMLTIRNSCDKLKLLDISHTSVTPRGVETIAPLLVDLEELNFQGCPGLSSSKLGALQSKYPTLTLVSE